MVECENSVWQYLRGVVPYSLCDWPKHPCTTLFLGSCNLRCPTCHNHVLAWDMEQLEQISKDEMRTLLAQRVRWIYGVTITGGEPTFVPHLEELLVELKTLSWPVKLDTNGMRPHVVRHLLAEGLVEQFAVDVKGSYQKYPQLSGDMVSSISARANLEEIFSMAEEHPEAFYFRLTKVPCLTDEDVETARSYLPVGFDLKIQSYVPPRRNEHAQADIEARRPVRNLVN